MDDDVRARVAGKQAVALRTVWQIQAGLLALRCVADVDGGFVVQARQASGWEHLASGDDALELLRRVIRSKAIARSVDESIVTIRSLTEPPPL